MTVIETENAPRPSGHYVQGTAWNGLLFISGQLPNRPGDTDHVAAAAASFRDQARQALANLFAVAEAAGGPSRFLKVNAYIVGIENWPVFNEVYASLMQDARPARAVIPVPCLHHGYLVEVDAVVCGVPDQQI